MDETFYLTAEGRQKLEQDLAHLRTVRRTQVAERLHNALEEGGELGENAEYEDAKNEQAFVEGEIARLEHILAHAQLIKEDGPKDAVRLGSFVTLREKGAKEQEVYHLVGEAEADPSAGKISHRSPMGQALIGRKVKDEIIVHAPDGDITFILLKIG